ncbi:MAG TPA: hypothetical protein VNO30_02895 [Kofleriaceae bacterium]|nr:hypothetical protein [Kofleriaceae bacterium]
MLKNTLGSLLLAALLLPACVVRGSGSAYVSGPVAVVEVEEEPPPPRVVVVDTRPGFIWIEGRWLRRGGNWHWHDGHYERMRSGEVWTQGRWERRGNRHVWVEGRWNRGAAPAPAVRDHREHRREERREDRRDNGPVIRDHRR